MIHQVESTSPKLLIYTHVLPEWYKKSKGEEEINKWFFNFARSHYTPIARFEYFCDDTLLITDAAQMQKMPTYFYWISIYEIHKK
jgi:hypothetical protein